MAPVESNFIPRDATAIATMAHLKIVNKAFQLPLVNDAYIEVSKLAQPLSPYIEAVKDVTIPLVEKLTPIVEAKVFAQLSEGTTTRSICSMPFMSIKSVMNSALKCSKNEFLIRNPIFDPSLASVPELKASFQFFASPSFSVHHCHSEHSSSK